MKTQVFYRIILCFILLFISQNIQAEDCKAKIKVETVGSACEKDGKANVTVKVINDDGSEADLSKYSFQIRMGNSLVEQFSGKNNVRRLAPGSYTTYTVGPCEAPYAEFTVELGLKILKAEYKRCSASDILVSVAVSGGVGPYTYQIIDHENKTTDFDSPYSETSFTVKTASSGLKIKVTDKGCSKNTSVAKELEKKSDLSAVSAIEGDKEVCKDGTVKLSVKSEYSSGTNFLWKKGNDVKSSGNTMEIGNVTEADAGEYTFSMNFDGCDYSESFTVGVGSLSPPDVKSPAYICLNTAEIPLSNYAFASSNNSLVWYDSKSEQINTPKFNPSLPGTYEYYVSQKNSTGCESVKVKLTVIVEELPAKAVNYDICLSNSKPKIKVVNKAGNYTYNLYTAYSGGTKIGSGTSANDTAYIETTQDLDLGKSYFLETVNTHGCIAKERTTVTISLKESLISGTDKICFGDNLLLSADYGSGKISWTMPDNTVHKGKKLEIADMDFGKAGVYKLLIEESGCIMKDEIDVKVTRPATPAVDKNSYRFHENETATPLTATPNNGLTLKWYDPDDALISGQSPVPATDKTGTFIYHVSQDSLGCESDKVPVTVIVGTIPSAVPASDINICIADKPAIQIGNTVQDYKYTVSCKNNVIAQGTGNGSAISLTSDVSITENSEFEITVSDIYGVKSAATKKSVTALSGLIAESPSVWCVGSDIQLTAIDIPDATYSWTLPNGDKHDAKSVSVSAAKSENSGIYTLEVTTSGCPVAAVSKSVSVTRPTPPAVDKDSYRFYENENAAPLTATPNKGLTLKWYNPDGVLISGQSPVPATDRTGTFIYHVSQDSLGCESEKIPVTVVVGTVPSPVPAADINICIADKPSIQISNTVQDYKYTVYYKNSEIAQGTGNGAAISMTSTVSVSENTELEIAVSDIYGVSSVRVKKSLVSVNNLVDLQNSSLSICDGSSGKLTAVAIPDAVYSWTTPNNETIDAQSLSIDSAGSADAGIYTVTVTTSGCAGAQQSVEVKVEKPAKPSTAKEIFYCTGDNAARLTATPLPGYKPVWFDASETQLSDAPIPNTSVEGTSVYYVSQVSITDANCSSDREEITVVVENKPDAVVLDPVNVCSTDDNTQSVSVRIPVSSEGYIYSLYFQETGGSLAGYAASEGDGLPVDITVNDSEIQSGKVYYLEVTNKAGCGSDRTPVEIVMVKITLSPDELPPYQVEEFYSQRIETNASSPKYSIIQGYLPTGFTISSTGDISGTVSSYAEPSVFTVEVTNDLGCAVQKEYTLKGSLLVSKMFSPNGDGVNDIFMKGYRMIIFDRLGRKLYSGDGWDGTFNSKTVPEDVYYYILYYKDEDGREKHVTGYVTLIKTM